MTFLLRVGTKKINRGKKIVEIKVHFMAKTYRNQIILSSVNLVSIAAVVGVGSRSQSYFYTRKVLCRKPLLAFITFGRPSYKIIDSRYIIIWRK